MVRKTLLALAVASLCTGALAAVTADEAKQLGTTLTPIGAERAANKDGTIPEWTGALKAPANFQAGSTKRPDPFAGEKPRLVIDAKNAAAQADKLTGSSPSASAAASSCRATSARRGRRRRFR